MKHHILVVAFLLLCAGALVSPYLIVPACVALIIWGQAQSTADREVIAQLKEATDKHSHAFLLCSEAFAEHAKANQSYENVLKDITGIKEQLQNIKVGQSLKFGGK